MSLGLARGRMLLPRATPRAIPGARNAGRVSISRAWYHSACDQDDFEVANPLIATVEFMLRRPAPEGRPDRRIKAESLVAAHERLWSLRHPAASEGGAPSPSRRC